ncbi:MAG: penicillin acylase family protein [Solirubrobacterales bacterium]|jgi:penicillin amidase
MALGTKVFKSAGLFTAGFATLSAAAAAGLRWQLFRRPLPQTEGRVSVDGIEGPIEISRDRWGVPHIRARARRDLWFGQGYCLGQDRLWQMHIYRELACGRIAAFGGAEGLPVDRLMRTLGLHRTAKREVDGLDDVVAEGLAAYSAGINAGATARPLPAEFQLLRTGFEPWAPSDSLTIAKLLAFGLSTNWERELLRADMARNLGEERAIKLDPGYPAGNPVVLNPGEAHPGDGLAVAEQIGRLRRELGFAVEATGSNNWAVSGARSATGGALIAGDPHLPPSMPGITYQVGLYEGDRFARGAALPGLPGVTFGQNNDLVWTFTNAMADVLDLYVERIDLDTYEFEGEQCPLKLIEEEIPVKGREPERLVVRETHHGPIVNAALGADDHEPLALSWAALHFPGVSAASFGTLDPVRGSELLDLLAEQAMPVSNLVWADGSGSIGYKTMGRIPKRQGDCPDLPKPGWTGEYEWDGWVPYSELPELTDPDAGYVVTANNRITPEDFPHHISTDYLDGYRAKRISDLIEGGDEHDLEDFAAMQMDLHSIPGVETARRLVRLTARDQRETAAIERLRSWDGQMGPDSIAATIYQAFTLRFAREVGRAAIGDRDLAERWMDRADNGFIAHITSPWRWQSHMLALWEEGDEELIGGDWDELALDSLRGAMDELADRFGPDPSGWRWGKVHALDFPHALGAVNPMLGRIFNRTLEVGGAQETVAQVGWNPNDPFAAIWAPCWRIVADPAAPERSRWQAFTGQSGQAGSPHYDDLQKRWAAGETQAMTGEGPWQLLLLEP